MVLRLIGFIFLFGTGHHGLVGGWVAGGGINCAAGEGGRGEVGVARKREQARPTAAAYSCLPAQIYRFLAQCKDYQRELYGRALAL